MLKKTILIAALFLTGCMYPVPTIELPPSRVIYVYFPRDPNYIPGYRPVCWDYPQACDSRLRYSPDPSVIIERRYERERPRERTEPRKRHHEESRQP